MDLDADGNDEIISGSYWPGHVFVFQGLGEGEFAAGKRLEDSSGRPLIASKPWKKQDEPDMDSLAAAPWMVDWDADGDLDLLVGNIAGRVILIENEGTAKQAKFGTDRTPVLTADSAIRVPGGDAGPHTADWDGDGKWDLLVGAGDGSVWFFRNVGEKGKPKFAEGRMLVDASRNDGARPRRSGMRAKICVADYDGDGHLDLLVGDFASITRPAPELTTEQLRKRDELRKKRQEITARYRAVAKEHADDAEARKKALEPILKRLSEVRDALRPLEPGRDMAGWVWFYRRRADL